ncbi:MAG TPA: hypothetical protein VEY95_03545 [Azospirillaceae bacterium]|nr:hypothetical protein [Azospirillaceae bacterium]
MDENDRDIEWGQVLRVMLKHADRMTRNVQDEPDWKQDDIRQRKHRLLKNGLEKLRETVAAETWIQIDTTSPLQDLSIEWNGPEGRTRIETSVDFDGTILVRTRTRAYDPRHEQIQRAEHQDEAEVLKQLYATVLDMVTRRKRKGPG